MLRLPSPAARGPDGTITTRTDHPQMRSASRQRVHPRPSGSIAAEPLRRLHGQLLEELALLKRIVPDTSERVYAHESFAKRLGAALNDAEAGPAFVSVGEFARAHGRSERAMTRLCRLGKLPAKRVGNRWSIDLDEFERLQAEQSEQRR